VIKVEPPGGDGYRTLSAPYRVDYNWMLTSRNKRSIAIDLTQVAGQAVLQKLLGDADVFVVNYFDDQLARFGIDYERVRTLNPGIIFARLSAYGSRGPEADKRGFDSTGWWARTGMMDLVRDQGQAPVMGAPGFGDHSSAMSLFGAIMLGLYRRERTGEDCFVETSLLANGVWANGMQVQGAIAGFDLGRLRQEKGLQNPFTSVFATGDGRHVLLAVINVMKEWPRLCRALDREQWLGDERFADFRTLMRHRLALKALMADVFAALSLAEVRARLEAEQVTFSVVQNLDEVIEDPQARAAGVVVETGSEDPDYRLTVASPIEMRGVAKRAPGGAPAVGEHSIEILRALGHTAEEIAQLLEQGAVVGT
ncbi:MAG: CoA transferase, partial [Pseudomonadales bacterium]|nr:CoA transferase [Pseudomonadales bacterium]